MKRTLTVIDAKPHESRWEALQRIPGFWTGRAIGRMQATDSMDLSRDVLVDHQAVAGYEAEAKRLAGAG